jgi:hypothetical protein
MQQGWLQGAACYSIHHVTEVGMMSLILIAKDMFHEKGCCYGGD